MGNKCWALRDLRRSAIFIILVMTNRLAAVAALILIPIVFGPLGGFGAGIGDMMVKGIVQTAPTAVMLVFALLYFLIMYEQGLFEPFINGILRLVGEDPVKIVVGTAVLVMVVGFDGDSATGGADHGQLDVSDLPAGRRQPADHRPDAGPHQSADELAALGRSGRPRRRSR